MKLEISNEEILAPIIDRLDGIAQQQKTLTQAVVYLSTTSSKKVVWKISDIAAAMNLSYEYLRTTGRYLLPRFGESAFPSGAARWPLEECLAWMTKPDAEKRAAYQEYQRQQLREEARKRQSK